MELIKDLGMQYPSATCEYRARFGLYRCQICGKEFKTRTADVRRKYTTTCGCAKNRKLLYGHGINDVTTKKDVFYQKWQSMLTRVFSEKHRIQYPTYKDCTVSKEWLTFSVFKKWMESQNWEGMHLDKDILYPTNKHYSAETCLFVTPYINNLMSDSGATRGNYPMGVHRHRRSFVSSINFNGKFMYLGSFKTPEEAEKVYLYKKIEAVEEAKKDTLCAITRCGLAKHITIFKNRIKELT